MCNAGLQSLGAIPLILCSPLPPRNQKCIPLKQLLLIRLATTSSAICVTFYLLCVCSFRTSYLQLNHRKKKWCKVVHRNGELATQNQIITFFHKSLHPESWVSGLLFGLGIPFLCGLGVELMLNELEKRMKVMPVY